MSYVDGYVLVIPKKNIARYRKMAEGGARLWMKHGALDYKECIGDDMKPSFGLPFPKIAKAKANEVVVFSFVTFKSRKHRDAVNKKIMSDPSMNELASMKDMPFDPKRMAYGGFEVMVEGKKR